MKYSLFNGDCLEVMPQLGEQSVDLVLCDLPYGCTRGHWDTPIDLPELWKQYKRLLKPRGCVVLFGIKPFVFQLGASAPKGWFRYDWIWRKSKASNPRNAKIRPMRAHEELLVFAPTAPRYYPIMRQGDPYDKGLVKEQPANDIYNVSKRTVVKSEDGLRYPRTDIYFRTAECDRARFPLTHRTQKPQDLLRYMIETYTREGDTVLDNCFGSCSTGVAALHTGRDFFGIEMDKGFFDAGSAWMKKEHDLLYTTRLA